MGGGAWPFLYCCLCFVGVPFGIPILISNDFCSLHPSTYPLVENTSLDFDIFRFNNVLTNFVVCRDFASSDSRRISRFR